MDKFLYEQLSTSDLQKILKDDCDGRGTLTVEETIAICEILVQRDGKDRKSAREAWAHFLKYYMDDSSC